MAEFPYRNIPQAF